MTFQCVMLSYMAFIAACVLALTMGSYLYFVASSECIKGSLLAIDQSANQNIFEQFIEFIEFHSLVKQLSECVQKIFFCINLNLNLLVD